MRKWLKERIKIEVKDWNVTNLTSILLPNILRQEDNINQDNKVKFKKQRPSIVMQLLSRYLSKKIEDANSSEISEYMIFKKKADTEYDKIRKLQLLHLADQNSISKSSTSETKISDTKDRSFSLTNRIGLVSHNSKNSKSVHYAVGDLSEVPEDFESSSEEIKEKNREGNKIPTNENNETDRQLKNLDSSQNILISNRNTENYVKEQKDSQTRTQKGFRKKLCSYFCLFFRWCDWSNKKKQAQSPQEYSRVYENRV